MPNFGENTMAKSTKKPAAPKTDQPSADKDVIAKAVSVGTAMLKQGGSKADAARAIFALIHDQPRDAVIEAFIKGATITPKGAPTYYYNVSRKFKRQETPAGK
jgi:hypothetical protein